MGPEGPACTLSGGLDRKFPNVEVGNGLVNLRERERE